MACNGTDPIQSPSPAATFDREEKPTATIRRTQSSQRTTPTPVPSPQPGPFDFLDSDHGWLVAYKKELERSTLVFTSDAGRTWTALAEFEGTVNALDFVSPDRGWLANGASLLDTRDAGKTWHPLDIPELLRISNLIFVDGKHGWLIGSKGEVQAIDSQIYITSDGGESWGASTIPCHEFDAKSISFIDVLDGWLACAGQPGAGSQLKRLYRTTDGGQGWQIVSATPYQAESMDAKGSVPIGGYLADIFFLDGQQGWLTLRRSTGIYTSQDGGLSWTPMSFEAEIFSENVQFLSQDIGYIVTAPSDRGALLQTVDGGTTWNRLYPPPYHESCDSRAQYTWRCFDELYTP